MLLPSGNPIKCHEEVSSLQPMIPPKRFDIFFPLTEGCSEGLDALRFFFKQIDRTTNETDTESLCGKPLRVRVVTAVVVRAPHHTVI